MKIVKHPLIPIVIFFAAGIVINYKIAPSQATVFTIVFFTVAAFTISGIRAQKTIARTPHFFIATCALSLALGAFTHWSQNAGNNSSHYMHFLTNDPAIIKGTISDRLKPNQYNEKYFLKVSTVDGRPSSGKLLVSVPIDSVARKLHAGQVILVAAYVKPVGKPLNPFQFDYSEYMANQDVFHEIRLKENYTVLATHKNFDYYIGQLRTDLTNSFTIQNYPPQVRNIINALLLGQRQDMDKETIANYTNAGVIHILAISGLHFATLFYILSVLFKPLYRFNKNGRLLHLILILSILWTFAFITGLSASVVRSVVMFTFVGIGQYLNRNPNIFNSLALSMLALLIVNPAFLFDVGFQLSYAAVFAIVWLQPLYSRLGRSKYKVVNYLADTLTISLVAQIGVLPLSLYYFNQFPLLFLVANVIVIPLSTIILLLGITVLALNFIFPAMAIIAGKALAWLITAMNTFIGWVASYESFVIKDIPFTLLLNIMLYGVLILFVRWMYIKSFNRTAALLLSVLLFQLIYTFTAWKANSIEEFIVYNNRKATLLSLKGAGFIEVYSPDSLATHTSQIREYSKEHFNDSMVLRPVKNVLWFNDKRILVLDSTDLTASVNQNPDILLLTKNAKVNLERVITQLKPKQVIADGTNYTTLVRKWRKTCTDANIPFHATEDGFFRLSK